MDARRHLLEALGYGTTRPMPEPEPTLGELLNEACEDAVAGDKAIASLKSEMSTTEPENAQ